MAHFYLIRHAQPDYEPCSTRGYMGQGRDLAPLTEKGVQQAEAAAHDARLKDIKLIVSSPYTRAPDCGDNIPHNRRAAYDRG